MKFRIWRSIFLINKFLYKAQLIFSSFNLTMASSCMGLFGDFKYSKENTPSLEDPEIIWVSKRYNPVDERSSVPVGRFKTIKTAPPCDNLPLQWVSSNLKSFLVFISFTLFIKFVSNIFF